MCRDGTNAFPIGEIRTGIADLVFGSGRARALTATVGRCLINLKENPT
jgi:hypothetical protein